VAISWAEAPISAPLFLQKGICRGRAGWLITAAATLGTSTHARTKLPVRHMPITPIFDSSLSRLTLAQKSTQPVSDRAAFAASKQSEFAANANPKGIQDVGAFARVSVEQGQIDVEFRVFEVSAKDDAFGAHAGQLVDENDRWSGPGMIDAVAKVLMGELETIESVKGLANRKLHVCIH
jgi:hypothetical protein